MGKEAGSGSVYIIPREEPRARARVISRVDFTSSLAQKFNDRAILKKVARFLAYGSEGAADVLHNCNKVENRGGVPGIRS